MLGTDYPFPLGEHEPGKLIESMEEFDEELKVQWFHIFLNIKIVSVLEFTFYHFL